MSKNFSGKFYLFYRIYDTEILSTKLSFRLFGVDSTGYNFQLLPMKLPAKMLRRSMKRGTGK